jgi:antitoxin component YwqK of YwqJK toxin-antitoxin module
MLLLNGGEADKVMPFFKKYTKIMRFDWFAIKLTLRIFLVSVFICGSLCANTIYLRDGQVITDIDEIRQFENIFLYSKNSRSISISKDRIQRVEDTSGQILFEYVSLTMEQEDENTDNLAFRFFRNGVLVGRGFWFDEGKFRIVSGTIPDGTFEEYYPSGRIKREYPFAGGQLNGVCREYYASGVVERESTMIDGLEDGVSKNFHQNTLLKGEATFVRGEKTGPAKLFYESGSVRTEMNFVMGVPEGLQRVFYETGEVFTEVTFENGSRNGEIRQFYENGNPQMVGIYRNGLLEGEVTIFYESGRVKDRQLFRNGRIIEN